MRQCRDSQCESSESKTTGKKKKKPALSVCAQKKKKKGEICEMKQKRKGSVTKGHGSKLGSHQDIFKKMTVDMH